MSETPVKVLVFSDNSSTRQAVITGVGFKASKDTAPIEWLEAATSFGVFELVDSHDIAVLVLDGETQKEGGRSLKNWQIPVRTFRRSSCSLRVRRINGSRPGLVLAEL